MEQNHSAQSEPFVGSAGAPALSLHPYTGIRPDESTGFGSGNEEDAYWEGVADGIRQSGGIVPPRLAARAAGNGLLDAHCDDDPASESPDRLGFDPAQVRPRHDGWTPERQIAFVEALADCGIIRQAAAKVGMSEQSVANLRRRADAHAFNVACDAALAMGGRRLMSIAYERAVEGSVKRHYFHGELKAEERVYDNRLLIALINKLPAARDMNPEATEAARNWEDWTNAIAAGRRRPEPLPPSEPAEAFEGKVWEDEDALLTNCPPPDGFDGFQEGEPGEPFYQRVLSDAERSWWEEQGENDAEECCGIDGTDWLLGRSTFFPWGSQRTTSSAASEPENEQNEARDPSGEEPASPADGAPEEESDQPHGSAVTAPPGS